MIVRTFNPTLFTAIWLMPVLALLQASLVGHFSLGNAMPSIVLIAVVDWGILRGMDEGMLWALLGGICLDVFSGWPFGTSAVALVVTASVVSLGQSTFMRTHALLPIATVFAATVLYYGVALFILLSAHETLNVTHVLRDVVIPSAVYNAVLNIPAFRLMQLLEARIYPVPRAKW